MTLGINNNPMAANAAHTLNAHYRNLATSTQRLSSGLRINSASDDAAGLAIRELMRADIAATAQGVRNANDAISLIQVADGALGVIDEKLIRMKELAEQAATGTYDSTQRLMIDSEFQAMASEIERIARATDFNGIKLLDGSRQGDHDGSGLEATGKLKIHFGSGNDSAEDYYYLDIADCTLAGLGLREPAINTLSANNDNIGSVQAISNTSVQSNVSNLPRLDNLITSGNTFKYASSSPNGRQDNLAIAYIPAGTEGLSLILDDFAAINGIQIFTTSGKHIVGTTLNNIEWNLQYRIENGSSTNPTEDDIKTWILNSKNGFNENAMYDATLLNGFGQDLVTYNPNPPYNTFNVLGMNIGFSGVGLAYDPALFPSKDYLTIDRVTEDIIFCIAGDSISEFSASWSFMPTDVTPPDPPDPPTLPDPPAPDDPITPDDPLPQGEIISIKTQEKAQQALTRIDDAIVAKDKVRAHLGAMQNRLENTVSNLSIQGENLQAAESRISDTDVATEMTQFVRNQVLTQSAVAMLGQANSYPHMLAGLLNG